MNFWWCNQRRDWGLDRPAGVVCSTDQMERLTYRQTVGQVRAGDIVIPYGPKTQPHCRCCFQKGLQDRSERRIRPVP